MANKPKPHDKKAGEGGPHAEGQPGGQGGATTTPPQQKPSPAIPGAPAKAVTPRKPLVGAKGEKASTGKDAPKADVKKPDPPHKVDTQPKPIQAKGKSNTAEKPPQVAKGQALFDPEPGLNFYTSHVAENESDTDMVIDTGMRGRTQPRVRSARLSPYKMLSPQTMMRPKQKTLVWSMI